MNCRINYYVCYHHQIYHMRILLLVSLLMGICFSACTPKRQKNTSIDKSDSSGSQTYFNRNEELYIVNKIGHDTVDPNGNKCRIVEMISSDNKYFGSCMQENLPEVGDSVWVGIDANGTAYIVKNSR